VHLDVCGGNTRVRAYQLSDNVWAEDPACYLSDAEIGIAEPPDGTTKSTWSPTQPPPAVVPVPARKSLPVQGVDA
jgi:hypothetical protein